MSAASAKRVLHHDPALLTEAELSSMVVELARLGGWTHRYHTLRSKGSPSGFPDWVFLKPGRLLFVELKSESGRVRPEQQAWLEALEEFADGFCMHVEVFVWRPSDFNEIAETLTGRKPREAA